MEELRQEIEELENKIEEKKLLCKPIMVPAIGGPKECLGPYELVQEIEELEKELERKKNLFMCYEENVFESKPIPKVDTDAFLLPEYRKGGYFTSQDFYDKCEEFRKTLEEQGIDILSLPRSEHIFLKKKFLQDKYGITWLAEEHQFLPGTIIDVHISHPNN